MFFAKKRNPIFWGIHHGKLDFKRFLKNERFFFIFFRYNIICHKIQKSENRIPIFEKCMICLDLFATKSENMPKMNKFTFATKSEKTDNPKNEFTKKLKIPIFWEDYSICKNFWISRNDLKILFSRGSLRIFSGK